MTPACTIQQEENPNAKPVPYLHSHPFPMSREQYERFLVTLDFAMPRWHSQFTLQQDAEDGCVVSKAPFATTQQVTGAIKTFLVMDEEPADISLPVLLVGDCSGEVR